MELGSAGGGDDGGPLFLGAGVRALRGGALQHERPRFFSMASSQASSVNTPPAITAASHAAENTASNATTMASAMIGRRALRGANL